MINIKKALTLATNQLDVYTDTARLDAEVLLAHVLAKSRTYFMAHPEELLSSAHFLLFEKLVARRSLGMPVAYLTGMREFWSLPLEVNEETLIPRPETELMVELALSLLPDEEGVRILELGTGSGAIALALAKERRDWQITAIDCSPSALKTAQKNAERLQLNNISFIESNWFENIASLQFDAILSNPPYIAANDPHLKKGDVRFEPPLALISGNEGLDALAHIIKNSIARLLPNGLLLIEHGFSQKSPVLSMLKDHGYTQVQCWQDLHGKDRVSGGRRSAQE